MNADKLRKNVRGTRVSTTNEDLHYTHNNAPDNPQNKNFNEKASRAVYLKNIDKHLTREALWKALNSLTRTLSNGSVTKALYVTKLDFPYANKNNPKSGNKGFGYLHLKTASQAHWLKSHSPLIIDDKYKVDIAPYINHRFDAYDHKTNLPKSFIQDRNNNSTNNSLKSSSNGTPTPSNSDCSESFNYTPIQISSAQKLQIYQPSVYHHHFHPISEQPTYQPVPQQLCHAASDELIIKNAFYQSLYENQIVPTEEAWQQYKLTLNQKLQELSQQNYVYPMQLNAISYLQVNQC